MSDGDHQTTSGGSRVLDDDDLLHEILLRVPPHPSSLLRASFVCKRWQRIVSDPWFLRCFRCHHRKPPLLGFFKEPHSQDQDDKVVFHPILEPPDRVPPQRFSLEQAIAAASAGPDRGIDILGCRHGRVTLMSMCHEEFDVFVCDPITGGHVRLPAPPELFFTLFISGAAVLCAADEPDHVHGACHSSPFKLVLASTTLGEEDGDGRGRPVACVYSSESGTWGNIIWHDPCRIDEFTGSNVLIGHALYWLVSFMGNYDDDGNDMSEPDGIVELDLDRQSLTVIKPPLPVRITIRHPQIIKTEDGGIGLVKLSNMTLETWHRTKVNSHDVAATWVLFKRVNLNIIFGPLQSHIWWRRREHIFGYDEDDNVLFICIDSSLIIVQLESMRFRRHYERIEREYSTTVYHPFSSFCTTW